jgi:hypothetical protein
MSVRTPKEEEVPWRCLSSGLLRCAVWQMFTDDLEAAVTYETSVNFYQTTRRNNPEDSHLHTRRRENQKTSH